MALTPVISGMLTDALETAERVIIQYRDGGIQRGYIHRCNGAYYIAFNRRSLVATRIDLDRIWSVRYSNSRVYLFRSIGRR